MDCCRPRDASEEIPLTSSPSVSAPGEDKGISTLNEEKKDRWFGYGLMYVGTFLQSTGLMFSRGLDGTTPLSQLNGLRFTAQMLISAPLVICLRRGDFRVEKGLIGWLLGAIISLITGTYTFYGSSFYLPVAVAGGVKKMLLLVFNYVISFVVNKTVSWYELLALALCIPGASMVAAAPILLHNPKSFWFNLNETFIFPCVVKYGQGNTSSENLMSFTLNRVDRTSPDVSNTSILSAIVPDSIGHNNSSKRHNWPERPTEHEKLVIGYLLCFFDAISTTIFYQITKRKLSQVNVFVCCFWGSLIGLVISYCLMGMTETPVFPQDAVCIVIMTGHILFAGSSMFFSVRAIQLLPSELTALLGTLQIPSLFMFQYTVLSAVYSWYANIVEISGTVMVFVGSVFVPVYEIIRTFCKCKRRTSQPDIT